MKAKWVNWINSIYSSNFDVKVSTVSRSLNGTLPEPQGYGDYSHRMEVDFY